MTPVLELESIVKQYGGLRPLRIERLTIGAGERVALRGIDASGAEVLVNMVTGATLPDSGVVRAFGQATSSIADSDAWLSFVDRFGIVSDRAVLLDPLTVAQNLSMPFSLEIEPPPPEILSRAGALAAAVGLPERTWNRPVLELSGADRMRVRAGRALALDPAVLLLEHPTASVDARDVPALGANIGRAAVTRNITVLAISNDEPFTTAVDARALVLDPITGRVNEGGRRGWFTGRGK